MKKGLKYTIYSLVAASCISLSIGAGVTYASYQSTKAISQQIGYQGKYDQASIFFNANIWEVDNAIYYIYNNSTSKWIAPTRTINPTINGTTFTLYVFVLQSPANTSNIAFMRVNPNGKNVPDDGASNFDSAKYFTETPKTVWNQTDNFTYSTSYNYYVIPNDSWTNGTYSHNGNEKNSGCKKNNLALNGNGDLYFTGSDSNISPIS